LQKKRKKRKGLPPKKKRDFLWLGSKGIVFETTKKWASLPAGRLISARREGKIGKKRS